MSKTLSILKYALEMEKQGYEFFKSKAEMMTLPGTKEMFERLAEVEMDHYNYLKEQINSLETNNSIADVKLDLDREKDLFASRVEKEILDTTIAESMVPDLTILRTAYLIEKDYAEFYRNAAANETDPKAKELLEALAQWEEEHERFFKEEYDKNASKYLYHF